MSMKQNGLAKLVEECGEVMQVAGKMVQYPELQTYRNKNHPDGTNLRDELEKELGDLLGAIWFVNEKLNLRTTAIHRRAMTKLQLFGQWDKEQD